MIRNPLTPANRPADVPGTSVKRPLPVDENSGASVAKIGRFDNAVDMAEVAEVAAEMLPDTKPPQLETDELRRYVSAPHCSPLGPNENRPPENHTIQKTSLLDVIDVIDPTALSQAILDDMKLFEVSRVMLAKKLLNKPADHLCQMLRDLESYVDTEDYRRLLKWAMLPDVAKAAINTAPIRDYWKLIGVKASVEPLRAQRRLFQDQ